ncbi:MAG: 2Fe-2S iron-sulfur cluster-binding protein, partial [Pseudomonadota bacterium]|nr:2Fe-2S iron-sulfur cluster-binding protein [Pseudomonadota bacterium]
NTEVYLHADTGKVIAHSNDHSRLKHLMLTLHFMDYTNTGGFNHPIIVVFGMATLMLAGSGLVLAYRRRLSASPSAKASVDVTVTYNGQRQTLALPAKQPLFFALTKHNISVPTECGGGGSCGQCVIQTTNDVPASPTERALLSDAEIASGKRLSCQHMAGEFSDVSVDYGEV